MPVRHRLRTLIAVALGACLLAASGCSDGTTAPAVDVDALMTAAWDAFVHSYYDVALERFDAAAAIAPADAWPHTGAAWSLMRLDRRAEADARFSLAATRGTPPVDLFAGWAFLRASEGEHASAIQLATDALSRDPAWVFAGGSGTNAGDLHLLLAAEHFLTGDYAASLAEVVVLSPGFTTDLGTAAGRFALATEIESLRDAGFPAAAAAWRSASVLAGEHR